MSRFRPSEWRREFLEAPIKSLQGELNRLFEEYWDPERPTAPGRSPTDLEPSAWVPPVDLYESANELTLRVDLPGVDPARVDLSLTGTVLDIRGDREDVAPEGAEERARERPAGAFHRQITLPEEVAFDEVQAECKHGVLIVRLPKRRDSRPRTIPIQPN
jgi:HSP20 family protein